VTDSGDAGEADVIDAEIVDDDGDGDVYDDGVIEASSVATVAEIEDAEVVGDGAFMDPDMVSMLRDTTGEVVVPAPPPVEPESASEPEPEPEPQPEAEPEPEVPLSFPRLSARTQRFTLGEPRTVTVSGDGRQIAFLRSTSGTDPVNRLWVVDASTGAERLVADPLELLAGDDESDLPLEERRRRERAREAAGGITSYAVDTDFTLAAFALAGRLFVADLDGGDARELAVNAPVFDPRPDPLARRVAYAHGNVLCVAELDGSWRVVAGSDDEPGTVTWGSAEFAAAEEMNRLRGFWWSPDGTSIAVARADTAGVRETHIGDPANPELPPAEYRYPFAGTPNAEVSLHIVGLDGAVVDVEWDRARFEYLTDVSWSRHGLVAAVQSRDQRNVEVLEVDPATGATSVRFADTDAGWVELVGGTPTFTDGGDLVTCADRDGARRLLVNGEPVTPIDLQVRSVAAADGGGIVFVANPLDDATVAHVWRYTPGADGGTGELEALTDEPGIHSVAAGGGTVVVRTSTLDEPRTFWDTLDGVELQSHAKAPNIGLNATVSHLGTRRLASVVLLPEGHDGSPLPVLVDPYGGPHALRAVRSHLAHLTSQWFANQGFAVVVSDNRGTPGRGSDWERAVHFDLATAVLEDQVDAVEQAAAEYGCLDLDRVAIRGWSFGGYLAALAVLLRPDRFHAAIAGAPVTEWRLYDTHYTERYLGHPDERADAYDGSSLLPLAGDLSRPLLLIHGLADDNVMAAHTLRLSSALLAAGRPHEVLPLVGVTHMTPQEVVAENLLLHQLDFLRRALGAASAPVSADGYGAV
jgi:dipeptidyl-peptidase-4